MLRCTIDINGKVIATVTAVLRTRMVDLKEVNLYDYTIVHIVDKDNHRLFTGEVSHRRDDGFLILIKNIFDKESWLFIEDEDAENV